MIHRLILILVGSLTIPTLLFAQYGDSIEPLFPTAPVIEAQKRFWIRIFTEVSSREGLLHDTRFSEPVYEKIQLRGLKRRAQRNLIKRRRRVMESRLREIAAAIQAGTPINSDQQRILSLFPLDVTAQRLREAAKGVRFQRGLSDRFLEGFINSGLYIERMRQILAARGVPPDLAYLPHVESSFNHRTYSRAGAAGIWQFTRGTGRQFMKIQYEVDERLDPLLATVAAAKLLAENYRHLKKWPLPITAYNHGRQSLRKIVARTGTDDLAKLIEGYDGWLFKFASKNFYAEFLAAREVALNPVRYFGSIAQKPPLRYHHVALPFFLDFRDAVRTLNIDADELAELNPSLRAPVLQSTKYIPKNYTLRLPERIPVQEFLNAIPPDKRHTAQRRTTEVIVARGDTLYDIGRRFNVSWQQIARANNISSYRRIRPGQRLLIPGRGQRAPAPAPTAPSPSVVAAPPAPPPPVSVVGVPAPAELPESVAFVRADGASLFQDLDLHDHDGALGRAEIVTAYGETLGHYAEWARVSTNHIRRINNNSGGVIRPGDRIVVPLERAGRDAFLRRRHEYHRGREEDFFSVYAVVEVASVRVRRGDSAWSISQSNDVPMWLFYQQNPHLIDGPFRAGSTVSLPIIEELSEIRRGSAPAGSRQAG